MTYRFSGVERVTIELDGTFAAGALALPAGLAYHGAPRVSLFAFFVEDLAVRGVPVVRSSYAEVLWRIAVRDDGQPAWWVACCDISAFVPRLAARRWVRYPTRAPNELRVRAGGIEIAGSLGRLAIGLGAPAATMSRPAARPILVGGAAEWEVPWGDDDAPATAVPVTAIDDDLGISTVGAPVTWATTAALRYGRIHRCGTARRRELAR